MKYRGTYVLVGIASTTFVEKALYYEIPEVILSNSLSKVYGMHAQ
jgi:hypothetical protein